MLMAVPFVTVVMMAWCATTAAGGTHGKLLTFGRIELSSVDLNAPDNSMG
jgi:hypothetical protein